ncbi:MULTISPECIES: AAA family ATPase [Pandoraea]|uniref:AAA family ATPase n=1 Tax=Pandoraea TaxID=93217 RepID=UPI001F5E0FBF|nr:MULTISPECIES: AAA family ATPase [Pandoraea]
MESIQQVASNRDWIRTERAVLHWSLASGLMGIDGEKIDKGASGQLTPTQAALRVLDEIAAFPEPAVFVLKDFHIFFGSSGGNGVARLVDATVCRKLRDLISLLKLSPKPKNVVLLSPVMELPVELQKDIIVLDFPLPTSAELRALLGSMMEANRASGRITIDLSPDGEEALANAALGLTMQEAENAFALAMVKDGRLCRDDVEVIIDEKKQVIRKGGILEFIPRDKGMSDVAGLENLKRWLKKRDRSWSAEAKRYGLPPPNGVLLTGVPGCGKSLIAKAISSGWQLPLLRLDVGRVFSGIVGSSEENLRRAIATAEAIAPSVMWIDEIEKGFGNVGGAGDSGTSSRVFASFLTWMQEKKKPVFVVATANNIQQLPAEMLRKGRFDEIFFVDIPTHKERAAIFKLHLARRLTDAVAVGDFQITESLLDTLAKLTEGYVGAEIEQVVIAALFDAYSSERALTEADLVTSITNTVPLSKTQAEQIIALRAWANERAVAATAQEDREAYSGAAGQSAPLLATRGGRTIDF